jgi:hypothetical protein
LRGRQCSVAAHELAQLWRFDTQLTEVEQAFKRIKHDLAIRPIFQQTQQRLFGLLCKMLRQHLWEVMALAFGPGSFMGLRLDLVQQQVATPAEAGRGLQVVQALRGLLNFCQQVDVMAPRYGDDHFSHSL